MADFCRKNKNRSLNVRDPSPPSTKMTVGGMGLASSHWLTLKKLAGKVMVALDSNTIPEPLPLPNATEIPLLFVIVGDEAFPLNCNMLRPNPGRYVPEDEAIYNYRLSRARRVIENIFGILASRWRRFGKPIIVQPYRVEVYAKACIALHN
uniref:DDE Tnp4 domain-containing protein n=1 Tax=Amphimedon queenslandica TaxID=400682 RepID=A0A1X7UZJ2_AMPQE